MSKLLSGQIGREASEMFFNGAVNKVVLSLVMVLAVILGGIAQADTPATPPPAGTAVQL